MKIYVIDAEANSLTPTVFWCIAVKEFKKEDNQVAFIHDNFINCCDVSKYELRRLSEFKGWLENENNSNSELRLVGHNCIDYDFHWFNELLSVDVYSLGCDIRDTYVLSRLAFPKRPQGHSVEAWGERLGLTKQEIAEDQWAKFDPIMVSRCIKDVEIQEKIYERLRTIELNGFSLKSIEIEHDAQKIISKQKRDGVFLDEVKVHILLSTAKNHADYLQTEIQRVFPPRPKLIREYKPKVTKDGSFARNTTGPFRYDIVAGPYSYFDYDSFNIDSPKQRLERLLEIGWKPREFTPTGSPKFTEESLSDLPERAPKEAHLLGEYLMCRNRERLAKQFLGLMDDKGYIHGYVDILGAATHRMASNSPNLQNIPSVEFDKNTLKPLLGIKGKFGWECRDLFCVEFSNINCFVDADASGIQLRGLAHYSNDSEYIRYVSDPTCDIHAIHSDVLRCSRPVAKTFIYALLMGAGARKLATVLGSGDVNKGIELLEIFFKRFPFLKEFKERLDREVERGYTIAIDGRLIRLDQEQPHKAMGVALQSYEAIVMKLAMKLYQDELNKLGVYFIQRLIVHDEFLVETKHDFSKVVGETMVEAIKQAGIELESKCPLDGNYKVGYTWAQVH